MNTNPRSQSLDMMVQRAVGYSMLASSIAHPDEANVVALQEAAGAAQHILSGTSLSALVHAALFADADEIAPAHHVVFGLGSSPDCPTYESAYYPNAAMQQVERMADIAGFYRAFGVEAAPGRGMRPDEILMELEFMAYLCRKQIHATEVMGAPRVAQVLRAQRMFLRDHLGQWGPLFGRVVAAAAPVGSFYAIAGESLARWIEQDCALLGAHPPAEARQPAPVSRESAGGKPSIFEPGDLPVV